MARIRTIKPEFFTSLTIADLSPEQRLTFIGLWTHVDDEGRCVDDPRLIKAAVWPLDDRTAADVEDDLRALTEASLITRYTLTHKRFMAVTGWDEHQKINRPTPSRHPAPEDGEMTPPEPPTSTNNGSLKTHGELTEPSLPERKGTGNREQGTGKGTPPPSADPPGGGSTRRGSRLPADFTVTPDMAAWASENAPACGTADHEAFCDYWRSVPGTKGRKADWAATWRNWMRKEQERRAMPNRATRTTPRRSARDDAVAQAQALKAEMFGDGAPPLNLIRGELA